jgi:uncharacterized protein (DUF2235 family)
VSDAHEKTIVICSDGTGNDYTGTESNVLRLYRLALKDHPEQVACYDPGIGTIPRPTGRTRLGRWARHSSELFFGAGAIENVTELYAYLMRQYRPGDRLFLFGFSRGAFTVRALAGMLHVCGLLREENAHLMGYAAGLYQTSEHRIKSALRAQGADHFPKGTRDHASLDRDSSRFKSLLSRPCTIAFMGVFDTVKAYGWLWPQSFPALRHNSSVDAVRHAVSLDERRVFFQMTGWGDRREPIGDGPVPIKEVWFAGDHSDVGGGHPNGNSALADTALAWMLGEATAAGFKLRGDKREEVDRIVANSRFASSTTGHDLRQKHWYWGIPCPRIELDNSTYPPRRRPRCWPTARRRPADHAEDDRVLLHDSVQARSQADGRYSSASLLRRGRNSAAQRPVNVAYAETIAITNFMDRPE